MGIPQPGLHPVADLRTTRLGKRLARRAARDELDTGPQAQSGNASDVRRISQIPVHRHSGEVMPMGSAGERVGVGAQDHPVAGVLQAQTQTPRPAE